MVAIECNVHSKAFAITIMTAAVCLYNVWYDRSQNNESKHFKINFHSIVTIEFNHLIVSILLIPNLFA